jgi:hypothetical protein
MARLKYTRDQLEQIVLTQLENLDAMHDLMRIMKTQSELIEKINKKLQEEISGSKKRHVQY